jgi:acyl-CoA synthetase (AMP-forming)/AMP-acid ligase II
MGRDDKRRKIMLHRYVTITQLLCENNRLPGDVGFAFLGSSGTDHLPYAHLWYDAESLAGSLQDLGIRRGMRIVLTLPTGPAFARVYAALQLCGAACCVLPLPGNKLTDARGVARIVEVARRIGATAIVCRDDDEKTLTQHGTATAVWTLSHLEDAEESMWQPVAQRGDDVAVIQATSGSTGASKCVLLTHHNILSNLEQIGRRLRIDPTVDVMVSWLPLFHDMGLIGGFLLPMYWRIRGVMMDPFRFLRDPANWLRAISAHRGTISPAPNFAYALTTQRTADGVLADLDLSSWRAAVCGAEPISPAVLERFSGRFASCGFRPDALLPAYGLAEASLCVAMHPPGDRFRVERVSREALTKRREAVVSPAASDDEVAVFCDCGPAVEGTRIRIVSPDGDPLPEGQVGQIVLAGPSIMAGYDGQPAVTGMAMRDGWYWTGDQGYLRDGRLVVTGRVKDLIIIRGQNYPPTEFEWAAEEVPGVRSGRVVAFGVSESGSGTEQLYLICEEPSDRDLDPEEMRRAVQACVARRTGVWPAHVGLVPRNAIPRTTSGKIQRGLAKANYLRRLNQSEVAA